MTGARAARLVEHGQPLRVEQLELAEPAPGEVLVELSYAGVNPIDRYGALGRVAVDGPLPRTLGGEAAGYLDGKAVLVYGAGLGSTRDGLFATAAVVPHAAVYELPDGIRLPDAACMGIAGLTAWAVVEKAGVGPDDRVLVLAASGGVGQSVVSYAASRGAQVWGQTGNASKSAAIREMGAEDAVVSDAAGLPDAVRGFEPTVVIDSLGGDFTAAGLTSLAPRGRLVLFGTSVAPEATIPLQLLYRNGITVIGHGGLIATPAERRDGLSQALPALADGRLKIRIDHEVALDDVNDAFDALADGGLIGKVVLRLRD